jgi:hypothetical protein
MSGDTLSKLERALKIPQKKNQQEFDKIADRVLSLSKGRELEYDATEALLSLRRDYLSLASFIVEAQGGKEDGKLRDGAKRAAESLVLEGLRIHLHSFRSNLLDRDSDEAFEKLIKDMKDTFAAKNDDYGSVFRFWGIPGLVVRIGDKCFRLERLSREAYQRRVEDERRMDTALDLANYGVMLLMLIEEGRSFKLGE